MNGSSPGPRRSIRPSPRQQRPVRQVLRRAEREDLRRGAALEHPGRCVVVVDDRDVVAALVHEDAPLRLVVVVVAAVAVLVIGAEVQQHRDMRPECLDPLELERRQLDHVDGRGGFLFGQRQVLFRDAVSGVPMLPHNAPASRRREDGRGQRVTVLLPLLPVMPTRVPRSRRDASSTSASSGHALAARGPAAPPPGRHTGTGDHASHREPSHAVVVLRASRIAHRRLPARAPRRHRTAAQAGRACGRRPR